MAEEDKNDDAPPEDGEGKKKPSKLIIIIAAAVVVLLGGGGAAAFFLMGSSGDKEMAAKDAAETEDGSASGDEHAAEGAAPDSEAASTDEGTKPSSTAEALMGKSDVEIDFGCTVTMKPFNLNLGNPLENRFIRLEVAMEYQCSDATESEITRRTPQLRDAVVSVVSRKTREFLLSPDGKDQLRLEVLNRVNHYMSRNVDNVYITDILIE